MGMDDENDQRLFDDDEFDNYSEIQEDDASPTAEEYAEAGLDSNGMYADGTDPRSLQWPPLDDSWEQFLQNVGAEEDEEVSEEPEADEELLKQMDEMFGTGGLPDLKSAASEE